MSLEVYFYCYTVAHEQSSNRENIFSTLLHAALRIHLNTVSVYGQQLLMYFSELGGKCAT